LYKSRQRKKKGGENMKRSWKAGVIMVVLFGLSCTFGIALSPPDVSAMPLSIILTGQFLGPEEKGVQNTYFFYIRGKNLPFRVDHVEVPEVPMKSGEKVTILNDLGAPRMRVIGGKETIERLMEDSIEGKKFRIQGNLHVLDGLLAVLSLEELE
jgi:hypothetical protein